MESVALFTEELVVATSTAGEGLGQEITLERLADHLEARTVLANGSGPSASDQEPAEANEPNPRGEIQ